MALNPFRRPSAAFDEATRRPSVSPPTVELIGRQGFIPGVPLGGATVNNPGTSTADGTVDRASFMSQLMQAYMACPHAAACIDAISRTITAGGVTAIPNQMDTPDQETPAPPAQVREVMDLLAFVNPNDDIRQLMRQVITDLLIFGDSFTEVVWLLGRPVALYALDPQTMTVQADEHGIVTGYHQTMSTGREANFLPNEVIHVKFDAPGSGLYGASPTQKNILPITAWLFTQALIKETMKRGDPLRAWVDWPIALPESEQKRFQSQYQIRNIGAHNIGNLLETKGGANLKELGINQLKEWQAIKTQSRDEILTGYGVPPSKVSVIEAGNLGAGTGTSQDRTFNVNTCGPIGELVMEKFSFALLYQAYGIVDWHLSFGTVDWRDDIVLEQIADLRIRNGRNTVNQSRSVIGLPPVTGGDDAFIVDRAAMVLYEDLKDFSKAAVAASQAKAQPPTPPVSSGVNSPDGKPAAGTPGSGDAESFRYEHRLTYDPTDEWSPGDDVFYSRGLWGPDQESQVLEATFRNAYQKRRKAALGELLADA